MNSTNHTIIVGGGIVGVCSAWYLARRGGRVTLLEQGNIADNASAGNAGIVALGHLPLPRPGLAAKVIRWMLDARSPLYVPPRFDLELWSWFWRFHRACTKTHVKHCLQVLAELGRYSLDCWEQILAAENLATDWRRGGWLDVFRSEAGRRHVLGDADIVRQYGFTCEQLSGAQLRETDAAFADDVQGAVRYTESTSLDPGRFLTALAARLPDHGVVVRESTSVRKLIVKGSTCKGVILDNGNRLDADEVVLAAGTWTTQLARCIGVNVPMQAGKGYHLDLVAPTPCVRSACVLAETLVAVNPLQKFLRLAGTVEFSGINNRLHERRLRMLLSGAKNYFKKLQSVEIVDSWCGLRPCTSDGLPVIGRVPGREGLVIATGHAKMGLTHGPATGRIVADLVLDRRTDLDISAFRIDRQL